MLRVEVEWIDSGAFIGDTWTKTSEVLDRAQSAIGSVVTVGQLVEETEKYIIVGLSYDPHNNAFYGAQVIERRAITKFTVLRARKEVGGSKETDSKGSEGK